MTSVCFPLPKNEKSRLKALYHYELLDTVSENQYDFITEMATRICNTKGALITLLDSERQFVKSHCGCEIRDLPRELSFCNYTILDPTRVNVVPDLRLDERYMSNPLVTGAPHAVFYAGAPIVTPQGFVLGSVCVLDPNVRHLTAGQQEGLKALAQQVMTTMELRKQNKHLKATRQKLKESAKSLKDFVKLMSHDMKTPLANITMLSKGFRGNYKDILDKTADGYIELIQNSATELISFIDSMVVKKNARKATSENKSISSRKVLQKVIGRLAPPKEIEINLQGSFPHVPVNEMALQQVFQNLLTNAIKYNDKPKGIINILAKKDNRFHHFYFSDNGAGIAEEQLETIFQKPSTYHATGGYQNKGTGIGLAQVKRIIESAGGNISVASKVNEGTDFRISLPQYN